MDSIKQLFASITGLFSTYLEQPEQEDRAVSMGQVYTQVDAAVWDTSMWLHDLYTDDDGTLYAIASEQGKLFRSTVTIVDGVATVGEWVAVEIQHVPVMRGLNIVRQDDGRYRWSGVACTAILNKSGEIDSTELFDRFVERFNARDLEANPVALDFFHKDIFFGGTDFIARDGFTLVASGLLADNEVGRAVADGLMADPDYWGMSISYYPKAEASLIDVDGIQFPVWQDGELERIALLPRDRASAWFTTMNTRSKDMQTNVLEALEKLVGPEQAAALAGQVDEVNDRVVDGNLIARQEETQDPAESTEPTGRQEGTPEAGQDNQGEPTDTQVSADVQVIREMRTQQAQMATDLATLVATLGEFVPDVTDRLAALEQSEENRRQAYLSDLPPQQARTIVRPRVIRNEGEGEEEVDSSTHVQQVLASKGL